MSEEKAKMLSETIKNLRNSYGISQVKLARDIGVSKQCVSNWENDNILPSIDMLMKLANYFKVSCDYLLGLDNKKLIDVTGLSDEEIGHIKLLINDLKHSNHK